MVYLMKNNREECCGNLYFRHDDMVCTLLPMEKEITMEEQVFYLLKNLELIKECGSFWELKEKLIMRDISWGVLKEKLTFSEDFVKTNATRIGEFIFAGPFNRSKPL